MQLSHRQRTDFLDTLWGFYARSARASLPWRQKEPGGAFDPYNILVSELMLQQTQVSRVIPKYLDFLERFPQVESLAKAELGEVLRAWQGLGYNRRAKFLWQASQSIAAVGSFPDDHHQLVQLPGIGSNTAGAILAYAFNQPAVFVETNLRTVYIHHFYSGSNDVHDKDIAELLRQTLDLENPREFYWAIMDYGSYLKKSVGNVNKASRHYSKQSAFNGSKRQVRGAVMRALSDGPRHIATLARMVDDERLPVVLTELVHEQMITQHKDTYRL